MSIWNNIIFWNWFSFFYTIFSMKHHWTWKAYPKATTFWWKALCPWSSTYRPAIKNECIVVGTLVRFKCCISQNSLSLIIRFYAGEIKLLNIFVELHYSLPVSKNLFLCKTHDLPVEDKIRIQRAGWSRKYVTLVTTVITALNGSSHICDWAATLGRLRKLKKTTETHSHTADIWKWNVMIKVVTEPQEMKHYIRLEMTYIAFTRTYIVCKLPSLSLNQFSELVIYLAASCTRFIVYFCHQLLLYIPTLTFDLDI